MSNQTETYRAIRARRHIVSRIDHLQKYVEKHCVQPSIAHKLLREIEQQLHDLHITVQAVAQSKTSKVCKSAKRREVVKTRAARRR